MTRRFAGFTLVLSGAVALTLAPVAEAEGLRLGGAGKSRSAILKSQMALLDGRLADQYDSSFRLTPEGKRDSGADGPMPQYAGNYRGEYLEVAKAAARKYDVPEDLFLRLVQQESGWNIYAVSAKGATGLAQLMPDTAERMGVDITDPQQNLEGGARYLKMMYDRFGTWKLALAAYNAGPIAVEEAGGIPDYAETKNYVSAILG